MVKKTQLEKSYSQTSKEIKKLLGYIKKGLAKHGKHFRKNSRNYGYLGELGRIRGELSEVNQFLNSRTDA